jgi:hypothetical protein
MTKWRRLVATAALASLIGLHTSQAHAFDSVVGTPPELGWQTVVDALSDGELGADDLAGPAFQTFWAAASEVITKTQICREAYANFLARGNNASFTFYGNMTVVSADGDSRVSYRQPVRVVPQPNGTLVVALLKGDGNPAKIWRCGGDNAADEDVAGPQVEQIAGATAFRFNAPEGQISVYMPTDMRVGDRISGTVVAEPNGDTDEQRQANGARLRGYVVDVGGNEVSVGDGEFSFAIIAILMAFSIGDGDSVLGEAALQVLPEGVTIPAIEAPAITQAGQPVSLPGQFDGVADSTQVTAGGENCPILAESPRQTVVVMPQQPTGPLQVQVAEPSASTSDNAPWLSAYNVRNVGIDLAAGRTTLRRGERTQVTLSVQGLQGITEPVPITLQASNTVRLQGGNEQTIMIAPRQLDAQGAFARAMNLQVTTPGPFDVLAMLHTSAQYPYQLWSTGPLGADYYIYLSGQPVPGR